MYKIDTFVLWYTLLIILLKLLSNYPRGMMRPIPIIITQLTLHEKNNLISTLSCMIFRWPRLKIWLSTLYFLMYIESWLLVKYIPFYGLASLKVLESSLKKISNTILRISMHKSWTLVKEHTSSNDTFLTILSWYYCTFLSNTILIQTCSSEAANI